MSVALRAQRQFAKLVAEELLKLLEERGSLGATGISSRQGKEVDAWRDTEGEESASTDPIPTDSNSESTWSMREARRVLSSMRRKKKPSR